jgi:hypothetical protein
MRAREFIVEYKRDITIKTFQDKLIQRIWTDRSIVNTSLSNLDNTTEQDNVAGMVEKYLKQIETADPTNNKQYVIWIIRRYLDGTIKLFEDISSTISEFLQKYHTLKVKKLLPAEISDINQIKDKQQFNMVFRQVDTIYDKLEDKPEVTKGKAKEIFRNNEVRVIQPLDKEASCYYGQGTRWCTAATKSNNYFDDYSETGNLYIFIPTKAKHDGEKYQLHMNRDDFSLSLMDKNDDPVEPKVFKDRFPSLDTKIFEIEPNLKYDYDFNQNPSEEDQKVMVQKKVSAIGQLYEMGIFPSEEIQLAAVSANGNAIRYMLDDIVPSEKVQEVAVANRGLAIAYLLDAGIKPSEKVQLAAVSNEGRSLGEIIHAGIEPSTHVQNAAVRQNSYAFVQLTDAKIAPSEETQMYAVQKNPAMFRHLLRAWITPSEELIKYAIENISTAAFDMSNYGIELSDELKQLHDQHWNYDEEEFEYEIDSELERAKRQLY